VGVIIGKGGDTIKYLQVQSGAKIQVTRDMDADPNSPTRSVEIQGTPEQIAKAEQLISEVLAQVYFLPSPQFIPLSALTMIKIMCTNHCRKIHNMNCMK
jgi:polyribonucleotide nucleotidyltransferase